MHGVTPLCITLCGFTLSLTAAAAAEEWREERQTDVEVNNCKNGGGNIRERKRELDVLKLSFFMLLMMIMFR